LPDSCVCWSAKYRPDRRGINKCAEARIHQERNINTQVWFLNNANSLKGIRKYDSGKSYPRNQIIFILYPLNVIWIYFYITITLMASSALESVVAITMKLAQLSLLGCQKCDFHNKIAPHGRVSFFSARLWLTDLFLSSHVRVAAWNMIMMMRDESWGWNAYSFSLMPSAPRNIFFLYRKREKRHQLCRFLARRIMRARTHIDACDFIFSFCADVTLAFSDAMCWCISQILFSCKLIFRARF